MPLATSTTELRQGVQENARLALQVQARALGANYVAVDYEEKPHRQLVGQELDANFPYWVIRGTAYSCP
jgi:hypothetical protein